MARITRTDEQEWDVPEPEPIYVPAPSQPVEQPEPVEQPAVPETPEPVKHEPEHV